MPADPLDMQIVVALVLWLMLLLLLLTVPNVHTCSPPLFSGTDRTNDECLLMKTLHEFDQPTNNSDDSTARRCILPHFAMLWQPKKVKSNKFTASGQFVYEPTKPSNNFSLYFVVAMSYESLACNWLVEPSRLHIINAYGQSQHRLETIVGE